MLTYLTNLSYINTKKQTRFNLNASQLSQALAANGSTRMTVQEPLFASNSHGSNCSETS